MPLSGTDCMNLTLLTLSFERVFCFFFMIGSNDIIINNKIDNYYRLLYRYARNQKG